MKLESRIVSVHKSAQALYSDLESLATYEGLMPESIEKFEIDGDSFIFGLKGMPEIRLVLKEKVAPTKIVLGAASSKIPFTLTLNISETGAESCNAQLIFNGEFNAMMAMMVKKPLTKFIDTLSDNIEKL